MDLPERGKKGEYYFGTTNEMSFALDYNSAKLYIWNQEIHTFCAVSGISILKREEEYRKNRNHEIKKTGTTIYYKGIELQKDYILDGIDMFEYIDIKGELDRSYININRRGFTSNGEKYFKDKIYRCLVKTVKCVLKYINTCKEREEVKSQLIKKIKENMEQVSFKENKGEAYNDILRKLAEQIVTVSFLGYWAVNDINDEISQLGSNCGKSEVCIWQNIITEVADELEKDKFVRKKLREFSMIFNIESYELVERSFRNNCLSILDIFKCSRHYAILQVRENQYAKWICYIISVANEVYKGFENIIFDGSQKAEEGGAENKQIEEKLFQKVEEWQNTVFEIQPNIGDAVPAERKYEQQFFLTWLAKNMPAMAVISDQKGNVRVNILSHYIYPCIYANQNHKLLIIERILKTAQEERIKRFSIYAWQDRQFLAVKEVPFSCYFINRGYLNRSSLHKVIFPLDGDRLGDIIKILDEVDKYEFIQNVKILDSALDYKSYLTELLKKYNEKALDEDLEEAQMMKSMMDFCSEKGQNLTSIIQDAFVFYLDFIGRSSDGVCDSEYFERMKLSGRKWHKCYLKLTTIFLESSQEDESKTGDKLKQFEDENSDVVKDIRVGYNFLRSKVEEELEKPQYSKIDEFKREYLEKCERDVALLASNERIQKYIFENSRYPIRRENMERCYNAFVEEIFRLLKIIENRKLHAVLINILKND